MMMAMMMVMVVLMMMMVMVVMMMTGTMMTTRREEGEEEEKGDAGHRLFKTRTQHHRMVGKHLAWRRTQPYAVVSTAIVNILFGGAPHGATNRMGGVPN